MDGDSVTPKRKKHLPSSERKARYLERIRKAWGLDAFDVLQAQGISGFSLPEKRSKDHLERLACIAEHKRCATVTEFVRLIKPILKGGDCPQLRDLQDLKRSLDVEDDSSNDSNNHNSRANSTTLTTSRQRPSLNANPSSSSRAKVSPRPRDVPHITRQPPIKGSHHVPDIKSSALRRRYCIVQSLLSHSTVR